MQHKTYKHKRTGKSEKQNKVIWQKYMVMDVISGQDRKILHTIRWKFIIKNSNFINYYINSFLYLPLITLIYIYYSKKHSLFNIWLSSLLSNFFIYKLDFMRSINFPVVSFLLLSVSFWRFLTVDRLFLHFSFHTIFY